MKKKIILFLLISTASFSQQNVLNLSSTFREIEVPYSPYKHTENINNVSILKKNDTVNFNTANDNKVWLKSVIKNVSKDSLFLVCSIKNALKADIYIFKNKIFEQKKIGFLIKSSELDFKNDTQSFRLDLAPHQEKKIIIFAEKDYHRTENIVILLKSRAVYNQKIINRISDNNYKYSLFTLLTGGILIMFFYNILLYFQYRELPYLYYSFHLLFTLLNYLMVSDALHKDFIGNFNSFSNLIVESTYVLSFIFYSLFIYTILENATQRIVKKWFVYYISFMVFYYLSANIVFFMDNYKIHSAFIYFGLLFRIFSMLFGFLIIFTLLKTHKKSYLRYIMYGTIVLIFSYLIHVVLNLITNNFIGNHYFNLIGTLIEILFFTYALNLRKKQAEQERNVLKKMSLIKAQFFANISHEFRTPLTLIKSPVQSLQAEITNESQKGKLDLIDKNSNRMLELVDQLLELSKIDSGKLQLILKVGNIGVFLNSLVESYEFQANENNLKFIKNIEKTANSNLFDKDVFEKIMSNLLSNAFKYTNKNETIYFESKIENEILEVTVSNTGSALRKEDLKQIFERFYQKDISNKGVGIGLALVKELITLYKGTIQTVLENGKLSFIINLPLNKNNGNALIIENENSSSEAIFSISNKDNSLPILLIVDDNQDIRIVLKDIFQNNYQILEAEDGEQALKIAKNEIPDCIISDVMMPKMDGFEFTKQIKNSELTSFIPIILLTARTTDESHLEGLKSTADAYLTKPFNNEIVKETVNLLITERKKLHQRYSQELVLQPVDIVINSVDEKFIEKLQLVLDKELSNADFSAEDFASAVAMSRMQLHRKLKSLLGVTSTEFLRNERLKTATKLLKKGKGNISDVAYAVGFNDISYFSKCFKEIYDCTPTEYIDK